MTDLREGRIQAFLDDEMTPAERNQFQAELSEDPELGALLEAQALRRESVHDALGALAVGPENLEAARSHLVSRLRDAGEMGTAKTFESSGSTEAKNPTRRPSPLAKRLFTLSTGLGRAAVLVLVSTGIALAAVPGSPVRSFLVGSPDQDAPAPEASSTAEPSEVRLEVGETLRINVDGLEEPFQVKVRLWDEERALVQGSSGSTYTTHAQGVDVTAEGPSVSVALPRSTEDALVRLNGQDVLVWQNGEATILGETRSIPDSGVVLTDIRRP